MSVVREEKFQGTAERIRKAAKARGFNQSSLSKEVGVSRSTVNSWWRGQYRPEGENLDLLCSALGVSKAHIAGYEETPEVNPVDLVAALSAAKSAHRHLGRAIRALESAAKGGSVDLRGASLIADDGEDYLGGEAT